MKLLLAAAFAILSGPVFAADPASMTCKELMAMDSQGMAAAGTTLKGAMTSDAKVGAMADADVAKMASDACTANPDGTVLDAVHTSMMNTMTCKDMMAMDDTARTGAGATLKRALKDDAKITAMADADLTKKAGDACTAHPDSTVIDALKM